MLEKDGIPFGKFFHIVHSLQLVLPRKLFAFIRDITADHQLSTFLILLLLFLIPVVR